MAYKTLTVGQREIRLITIIPAPDVTKERSGLPSEEGNALNDIIQCQLEHVPLHSLETTQTGVEDPAGSSRSYLDWHDRHESSAEEETPQWRHQWGDYVALSYAWGNIKEKRDIMLNGQRMEIGVNLENALRVLRDTRPIRAGYKIWVDALCINQGDKAERGREVNRMRQLYKEAADVCVWLGDEENESTKAFDLIRTLSKSYRTSQDIALGNALREKPDLLGKGAWRALSQLMDRPYWDRLWVMQELVFGGDRAPIFCGHQVITWGELYDATFMFGTYNFDIMFSLIRDECEDAGLKASGLKRNKIIHLKEEQLVQAGQGDPHHMCMLDLGRKSLATDPKDKIYGLLGMLGHSVVNLIAPDYDATLPKVFTNFAKAMIVANKNLEVLEHCTWPMTNDKPSWVPDWTDIYHYRLFSGRPTYHATRESHAIFQFENNAQHLICQGIKIDTIDGLGEADGLSEVEPEYGEYHEFKDPLIQPRTNNNVYGSEHAFRNALWRTMMGNRDHAGRYITDEHQCLLNCAPEMEQGSRTITRGARTFNRFIQQNADLRLAGRKLRTYFPSVTSTDSESLRIPQERMFRFLRTRRFMVTREGYIGLVPIVAQPDDLIALFLGCDIPILLRALNSPRHYNVVGACYVHGIMEGEAMEWLEAGKCSLEEFILC